MPNSTSNNLHYSSLTHLRAKSLFQTLLLNSILLTILLSGLYFANPRFVNFLHLKTSDIIVKTTPPDLLIPEIVTIAIDETSLVKYGQWPWPRYRVAQLLEKIQQGGAKSIGINIIFSEPDRTSPKIWQNMLENDFDFTVDTSHLPEILFDYDIYLAKILANGPLVLGYEFLFNTSGKQKSAYDIHPVSLNRRTDPTSEKLLITPHRAKTVICNCQPLTNAVSRSGFFNGSPDIDGIMRRLPLLIEFGGEYFPSFALAILMQFEKKQYILVEENRAAIPYLSFAGRHLPVDNLGNYLLGPAPANRSTHLSASDVLEGNLAPGRLKGKIVLVGLTASGLTQIYPTLYAPDNSLLDLHRYAIESLSSNFQTTQTPLFTIVEAAVSFLLCLLLALTIARLKPLWTTLISLSVICLIWLGTAAIYRHSGYLFSPLLPTTILFFNFCILSTLRMNHFNMLAKSETGDTLLRLKSSEKNLKSILETIPDIVFRLDNQGIITFISPAISRYVGSATTLLGQSLLDFVVPEDLPKTQNRLTERRTGIRATFDFEVRLQLSIKDTQSEQELRFFSISAEGIYRNNQLDREHFLGTQGIIRDITDRKRLEQQLIQAQKMEVLGNLAAGIAHDLNNILSGLVSYPDLLLLEIPKESPLYEKITIIQKSGKKAATIVQDLLTLARRNVDINDICNCNDIITDYLGSIEFQRIHSHYPKATIQTELQDTLMNVKGSAVHLSKVVMNILHNGLEAMPAGGNISISTINIFLDTPIEGYETIPEGEYICLTMSDTGVGIPSHDLHRIFEPFYTKKTMAKSGTGLGMTVIWATIKDHHGFIDIQSIEGQGTTFKIYLPITREDTHAVNHRIVLDDYIGSETLLVVDDISEQLQIAEGMLAKLGYTVTTASSGERALDCMRKQSFDLVILDMIMPLGLDGLETYMAMIQIVPNQKAIITSGFSESDRVQKLMQLGIKRYVQKPYSMEELGMAVRKELAR